MKRDKLRRKLEIGKNAKRVGHKRPSQQRKCTKASTLLKIGQFLKQHRKTCWKISYMTYKAIQWIQENGFLDIFM